MRYITHDALYALLMSSDKAKSKSVSMTEQLWELVERACSDAHEDRSAYVRRLILPDLQDRGYLPGQHDSEHVIELVREAASAGVDVKGLLTRALRKGAA